MGITASTIMSAAAPPSPMRKIELKHGSGSSSLTVVPFGGTIISWIVDGEELIFVSKKAVLDGSKAIRGGVPICFPNFGPWSYGAQHGFARTSKDWKPSDPKVDVTSGDVELTLELKDSDETRQIWDKMFSLLYRITLKEKSVELDVLVKNEGTEEFDLTFCFHTYFCSSDLAQIQIKDLKGLSYTDKTQDGGKIVTEENDVVSIQGFTDRVYANAPDQISVKTGRKALELTKSGLADWVVWNPYETAAKMSDMHENGYLEFVCVEATQATKRIVIESGETWKAAHTMKVMD